MANYAFKNPDLPDGSVIDSGNFCQAVPNTEIMVGKSLTINGGNFTNVKKQPEWTVNGGNFTQVNRCGHLHQRLVDKGLIPVCVENCSHVVDTDEIEIDGVIVATVYHHKDLIWPTSM